MKKKLCYSLCFLFIGCKSKNECISHNYKENSDTCLVWSELDISLGMKLSELEFPVNTTVYTGEYDDILFHNENNEYSIDGSLYINSCDELASLTIVKEYLEFRAIDTLSQHHKNLVSDLASRIDISAEQLNIFVEQLNIAVTNESYTAYTEKKVMSGTYKKFYRIVYRYNNIKSHKSLYVSCLTNPLPYPSQKSRH